MDVHERLNSLSAAASDLQGRTGAALLEIPPEHFPLLDEVIQRASSMLGRLEDAGRMVNMAVLEELAAAGNARKVQRAFEVAEAELEIAGEQLSEAEEILGRKEFGRRILMSVDGGENFTDRM